MESIKKYVNEYKASLWAGLAGVLLGYGIKRFTKKEMLPMGNMKSVGYSFAFVTLASVAGQELAGKNLWMI